MSFAKEILADCAEAGVALRVRGTTLVVDAPSGMLSRALLARLAAAKPEVIGAIRLIAPCERCGSTDVVDVAIHAGDSTRRDCRTCNATLGFTRWYGVEVVHA